ncbi:MAG: 8-oxoguanine deaminase, partial [Caldilineaceae bacterium]|nr:8-oxoguanine deaminase [Caldilineaceae bacterium]
KAADIVAFDLDTLGMAGAAVHDPVAALLFCAPHSVNFAMVNGRVLVQDGHLQSLELPGLIERHNQAARGLLQRAGLA